MKKIASFFIYFYQFSLSPFLGKSCRFSPSCSNYALEALEKKPLKKALALILKRFFKCHPLNPGGIDEVP
jgi:putative membrane protein insertion efficiency factor